MPAPRASIPQLVTSRDALDPVALDARGIRRLIRPDLSADVVDPYGSVNSVVQS